jgi:hypothetical protein
VEAANVTPFDRYHPAMAVFFAAPLIMALIFGVSILRGGSPIQPGTYGIIVWTIPAWVWVVLQVGLSLWACLAAARADHRSLTVAAASCGVLMEFFAAAAILGRAEEILLPAMAIPTGAICLLCAGIGWDHGR